MEEEIRKRADAMNKSIASDRIDYIEWLNKTLPTFNLNFSDFIKMSRAEKFTLEEILSEDYMLEKFEIWQEMFSDPVVDFIHIQRLFNNRNVLELSEYIVKHKLSIKEVKFDIFGYSEFPIFWEDVADTVLGILYEKE